MHVVRQVGDPELGQARHAEQLGDLLRHEHADPGMGGALEQRVHVLAEPDLVGRGRAQISQAVDQDPPDPVFLHRGQELVDPLVQVHVDRAAVHHVHVVAVERPAEPVDDTFELRGVLLEPGDEAGPAHLGALEDVMQPHQGLARTGRPRDERRSPRPQT